MGNCIYCGRPAGLLQTRHKECELKHHEELKRQAELMRIEEEKKDLALSRIHAIASNAYRTQDVDAAIESIRKISREQDLSVSEMKERAMEGWSKSISLALADNVIEKSEEENLFNFAEKLGYSNNDLMAIRGYWQLQKGRLIRDIIETGKVPEWVSFSGLEVNLMKNERIAWAFQHVDYYEEKTYKHFEGGSVGVSVRIMKGVYYRTSSFKGYPVVETQREKVDTGVLAMTDKCLYFAGRQKNFRIKYDKIVSFKPYSDALGIQKDLQSAKPQLFIFQENEDGAFAYNLVSNLSQL